MSCQLPFHQAGIRSTYRSTKTITPANAHPEPSPLERVGSKITSQGQVSIPAPIRQKLGLAPGSKVEWCVEGDDVIVRRAAKYSSQDIHDALFDAGQVERAEAFVAPGAWVSLLVLAETVCVLTSVYGMNSDRIATIISMLLEHDRLVLPDPAGCCARRGRRLPAWTCGRIRGLPDRRDRPQAGAPPRRHVRSRHVSNGRRGCSMRWHCERARPRRPRVSPCYDDFALWRGG